MVGNSAETPEAWDSDFVINDLTIDTTVSDPDGAASISGTRNIVLNNMTFTSCYPSPGTSILTQLNNCTVPDTLIQVDKQIETLEFNGCTIRSIFVQSPCAQTLILDNTDVTLFMNGTPLVIPSLGMGLIYY